MRIHRGFDLGVPGCAVTIGNFDGVHRGHQAMLALLINEARHRGVPSCVLTFEPHPRDHFARKAGKPEAAPARISTLRDKLAELERCGIDHAVVTRFDDAFAAMSPQAFITEVLVRGLHARYVLVGDDFSFGARRAGNYAMLDAAGATGGTTGFDVARMMSYEVHGLQDVRAHAAPSRECASKARTRQAIEVATGIAATDPNNYGVTDVDCATEKIVESDAPRDDVAAQQPRVDLHRVGDLSFHERQFLVGPLRVAPMAQVRGVPIADDPYTRYDLKVHSRLHR